MIREFMLRGTLVSVSVVLTTSLVAAAFSKMSIPGGVTWVFRGVHTFVIKIKKYP